MIEPHPQPAAPDPQALAAPGESSLRTVRYLKALPFVLIGEIAVLSAVVWLAGFETLPRARMLPVRIAFVVLGHVFMVAGFRFRKALKLGRPMRGRTGTDAVAARAMLMLVVAEAILLLGFVLRVLGGALFDYVAFSVWTLTMLATFYPSDERLGRWIAAAAPPAGSRSRASA